MRSISSVHIEKQIYMHLIQFEYKQVYNLDHHFDFHLNK